MVWRHSLEHKMNQITVGCPLLLWSLTPWRFVLTLFHFIFSPKVKTALAEEEILHVIFHNSFECGSATAAKTEYKKRIRQFQRNWSLENENGSFTMQNFSVKFICYLEQMSPEGQNMYQGSHRRIKLLMFSWYFWRIATFLHPDWSKTSMEGSMEMVSWRHVGMRNSPGTHKEIWFNFGPV